ncbi:hypothetical protein [Parvibaculum sp.]|uniref:hypothetical protein n=1 Tax=Parvibaculum sp. TaxID=2024848 RepID=UPI0038B3A921
MTRRQSPLEAALTMLCIVLTVTFSAVCTVQALHELGHQGDVEGEHGHHPVNQLAAAFAGSGDTADWDGAAGLGHHHHGDCQSNLPIWASVGIYIDRNEDRLAITPEHAFSDMPIQGPERPPKHLSASV